MKNPTSKSLITSLFRTAFSFVLIFFLYSNSSAQVGIDDYKSVNIDNLLRLTVDGNSYSDQTIIIFIAGATEGFDSDYDAYKLSGIPAAPQFYSIITCCNLAVNALPPMEADVTVQMGFDVGATTTYTISATDLYTFDPSITIHLFDSIDDVLVDLRSDSVYSFTASPGDISERFKVHFGHELNLDSKVYLEGPYNGSNMNTDLQAAGNVPLFQPYNNSPWNYNGTELVSSVPVNAVDWILVEFRDATSASLANSASMVERHAAFLMNDGTVRGVDGSSFVEFTGWYPNGLYVVIWHRNHLPVLTNTAITESSGIYTYDFSTGFSQAYGGAAAHKDIGSGIYGMMGGDTNADETINSSDLTAVWNLEVGEAGYLLSDINMDGQANNQDKDDIWVENDGESSQLP
ncbi:MAG: hypothetical protein DRJ05_02530 [Bacteroidetes bacterium]|nr:MAG: hypothetical protein DRJ05_02530 [Bacteroidota bacterium]